MKLGMVDYIGRHIVYRGHYPKNAKLGQKGSRGSILEFGDPLRISGRVEAINSKFGMQVDTEGNKRKK